MRLGSEQPYQPHKLIVPVLFSSTLSGSEVREIVVGLFGEVDLESTVTPFHFTAYYDREMGEDLQRVLFSLADLVDPAELASFKISSNAVEDKTARSDGTRTLNLDPGLLSLSRVILATTKASAHRIAIGRDLFAEITLLYRKGSYQPLEWTYPDFASDSYRAWLGMVRRTYHEQLKALDPSRAWRL